MTIHEALLRRPACDRLSNHGETRVVAPLNWLHDFGNIRLSASVMFLILLAISCQRLVAQEPATKPEANDDTPTEKFSDQDLEFFESKVRPILVERCFECHGPDSAFEGNLSVSSRKHLLEGGDTGPGIVLGKANESLIVEAIKYEGPYEMPPDTKMGDDEIKVLEEWINRGAPWTPTDAIAEAERPKGFDLQQRAAEHWCWQPIRRPTPPAVDRSDWARDELDKFILAGLEEAGLAPNLATDKRTWMRRVYFDLIGLPPMPDELQAFVNDDSEHAYEKVVDRLLASEHFGERWARHWMDLVRFAETYGHEFDYPIAHAWKYRDYLIRAFNRDVPYDQFTREHIAGDLLTEPRLNPETNFNESLIGTAFWFFGEATHAPVDVRGDEAVRVDNQIDVMSKTFLGLTIACARCHDHKFDAISTKDYYALAGFLQSSHRQQAMLDPNNKIASSVKELATVRREGSQKLQVALSSTPEVSNDEFWETVLKDAISTHSTTESDAEEDKQFAKQLQESLRTDALTNEKHPAWPLSKLALEVTQAEEPELEKVLDGIRSKVAELTSQRAKWQENSVVFHDFATSGFGQWQVTGEAFELLDPQENDTRFVWDSSSSKGKLAKRGAVSSGLLSDKLEGVIRSPTFTITHPRTQFLIKAHQAEVHLVIDEYRMATFSSLLFADTFRTNLDTKGEYQWIELVGDTSRYLGHRAHIEIIDQGGGSVSVKEVRFSNEPVPSAALSSRLAEELVSRSNNVDELTSAYAEVIANRFATQRPSDSISVESDQLANWLLENKLLPNTLVPKDEMAGLYAKRVEIETRTPRPMYVQAIVDGSGENEYVFVRGNHRVLGDKVPRRVPEVWIDSWDPVQTGSGRLEFANRLVSDDNPLVRRVIVNRIWQHLFGRGLVPTVDNFGVLGQPPSNQELLDYLAVEFSEAEEWSFKRMIRRLVLSQTYRMSSRETEAGKRLDPTNQLWHRMPIRRLEGEAIRDSMLYVTNNMDLKMYGPSVRVHLTPFMEGRGRPGASGPMDGDRRRSIYTEVRRNFLSPMMKAFDTPIPFSTMGRRNQSNVPAQALILMNDPFVHEMAKRWTSFELSKQDRTINEHIQSMYESAFARPATENEVETARQFLLHQSGIETGLVEANADNSAEHQQDKALAADVKPEAWQDLAHVLFNVKEFIYLK